MLEAKLFYDDDLDALRAAVHALGGYKTVGVVVWPDKTPDAAARLMADCCNVGRSERLKPSQLLLVMRIAREAGVHMLAEYFMAEAGYNRPLPVDPKDEAAALMNRMDDALGVAQQLASRLERLRRMQP